MLGGLLVRLGIAVRNGMLGPQAGLEMDAQGFYLRMVLIARSGFYETMGVGEPAVLNSMGFLMSIFGDTVLVACVLSSIVWWISSAVFVSTLGVVKAADRTKTLAALAFAFWPTAIAYTAITLREPFQLLFVCVAVHGIVQLLATRNPNYWLLTMFGLIGAGALHGALTAFSIILLGITVLFYALMGTHRISLGKVTAAVLLMVVIGYYGFGLFSGVSYDISKGVLNSAEIYQGNGVEIFGRTNYKSEAGSSGFISSIFGVPIGLFQYLFEPLPFRISAPIDVILFFENCIRFFVIFIAVQELRHGNDRMQRLLLLLLFGSYVLCETIWSLGTVNWGTASRHHVPAMGLLMLSGVVAWTMRKARLRVPKRNVQLRPVLR